MSNRIFQIRLVELDLLLIHFVQEVEDYPNRYEAYSAISELYMIISGWILHV